MWPWKILERLERKVDQMALDIGNLTAAVAQVEGVEASAEKTLKELADEIAALKNDPVALQALADRLTTANTALSAAIANPGGPATA